MRSFSALVKAALSGAMMVTTRFIVRGTLPSGTFAGSDSPSDLIWNNGSGALTYKGFDQALQISLASFDTQSKVNQAVLQLSATDPIVLTSLFEQDYRAAPADIALLLYDPATGNPGEELIMFDGVLDVASIADQPAKATDPSAPQISTLSLTVSPAIVDLQRSSGRNATDTDQRLFRDASDSFFQDVALVSESAINWGIAGTASPVNVAFKATTSKAPNGSFALPSGLVINL